MNELPLTTAPNAATPNAAVPNAAISGQADSPELLSALVRAAPTAIVAIDLNQQVRLWNAAAERMFGWRAAEVYGKPLPIVPPEAAASFAAIQARHAQGEAMTNVEVVRMRKDGTRLDISLNTSPLHNAAGDVIGAVGVMIDITAQKAAQRQQAYQAGLVDSVSDTIFSTDLDFRIQTWNRAAEQLYGWSAAEAVGQVSRTLLNTTYGGVAPAEVDRCLAEQGTWRGAAGQITRAGRRLNVQSSITVLRDDQGRPFGLVIVNRDDTERIAAEAAVLRLNRELEQRVRERTAQLEASNRELESFAYSVSHDLRAPLRSIDGFTAELARTYQDGLDDTARHYMDRVRAGVQRMGALIDGLLNLSRLTRRELRPTLVDLSALAAESVAGLRQLEPNRAVTVTIAPGLHAYGDPALLRAVFDNLIDNAWKFTGPVAAAHIEVGARTGSEPAGSDLSGPGPGNPDPGNPNWVYYVADNGVGLDMAYADKLFAPFQRLHRESEFPGTGVGLASVQRIVARHGGRIWVEAAVGQGATFCFTLPLQPDPAQPGPAQLEPAQPTDATRSA